MLHMCTYPHTTRYDDDEVDGIKYHFSFPFLLLASPTKLVGRLFYHKARPSGTVLQYMYMANEAYFNYQYYSSFAAIQHYYEAFPTWRLVFAVICQIGLAVQLLLLHENYGERKYKVKFYACCK